MVVANGVAVNTEPVVAELKRRAASDKWRHKIVYTFLDDLGRETVNLSFEDVDRAARKIAAALQRDAGAVKGDRVMLCYPPGLDFALAFWGCLYAGVVGIPVYPPYPDADQGSAQVQPAGGGLRGCGCAHQHDVPPREQDGHGQGLLLHGQDVVAGQLEVDHHRQPGGLAGRAVRRGGRAVAHAQRCGLLPVQLRLDVGPKAVMISHGNLRAQLKTWESIVPTDTMVSWLPSYHDMGLVGFIITPCVTAARCVSMSPISFIKDPALWMRTASKYKATHVCAPNFGYALAARKTSDKQAAEMDLSTLKQTICAAEPIRRESLDAFTSKFKAAGFDPNSFNCGYGLAEVTLVCTGQEPPQKPTLLDVHKCILETERKVAVVSSKKGKQPLPTTLCSSWDAVRLCRRSM